MKTLVAIVIHNRFANLKTWINCWRQCDQTDAELVVVHNHYGDMELGLKFLEYCKQNDIWYIGRTGPGFDIGAFQDVVCRGRTGQLPDYDYIIWCCDDTLPMSNTFVQQFTEAMKPTVGVAAMQISNSVAPHVRTTGFCIRRQTAERLIFPADPVTTKQHCYHFEHRGGQQTMTNQIRAMGLSATMVAPISVSPLWDSMHPNVSKRLDRQAEFNRVWGIAEPSNKVVFIVPIFEMYPMIIPSLLCQTHQNWELILIHNGPLTRKYDIPDDKRIKFIVHPVQTGKWGHPLRKWALDELDKLSDAEFVVISNADNYHIPVYIEYMLKGFSNPGAKASYCSEMTHNYKAWQTIPCSLKVGFVDCAGVMVRRAVATEVGWRDMDGHSSDWTYFSDIIDRYGAKSFQKVVGNLLVHN